MRISELVLAMEAERERFVFVKRPSPLPRLDTDKGDDDLTMSFCEPAVSAGMR